MKNRRSIIAILLVSIICIGYAYLSTQLNINGIANLRESTWDVCWDNVFVNQLNSSDEIPVINPKTTVTYDFKLRNPGDFIEFTVDAVNFGSINAMVDEVIITELTPAQQKYIKQSFTYASGHEIKKYHILKKGERERYKIKVEYKIDDEANEEDLPNNIDISLTFGITYRQATNEAIEYKTYAKLKDGPTVNQKLNADIDAAETELQSRKELSDNDILGNSLSHSITRATTIDSSKKIEDNIISTEDSEYPVYCWTEIEDDYYYRTYFYTEAEKIYLNENSSKLFEFDYKSFSNIDLDSFDTSKVENMNYMFARVYGPEEYNLKNFDTSNVTDMSYMFYRYVDCLGTLKKLDLSSFDTKKVENMKYMFGGRMELLELDVSSFDTSNVTDMSYMFYFTSSLANIDISSFNTSKVTNTNYMFDYTYAYEVTVGPYFSTDNIQTSTNMLSRMNNIIGGNGTTYLISNPTDKTYAKADGYSCNNGICELDNSIKGYFTLKTNQ